MDEARKIRLDEPHPEARPVALNRAAELLRQGQAYHQQRELAAAVAHYELAIGEDPDCAKAWHLLGFAQLQSGELVSAIDSLGRAATLDSASAEFRIHLAVALLARGEYRQVLSADISNASQCLFEDEETVQEHQRVFESWIEEARS